MASRGASFAAMRDRGYTVPPEPDRSAIERVKVYVNQHGWPSSDPMKDMVRRYDKALVQKGEKSIFALRYKP